EIEHALKLLPGVREGAVSVYEDESGEKRLVAYVVRDESLSVEDEGELIREKEGLMRGYRAALGRELPEYMVPQIYVFLESLPLTGNGKLARERLPAPQESDLLKSRYVAPRDEREEAMCGLWREVLKLEQVGVEDNF